MTLLKQEDGCMIVWQASGIFIGDERYGVDANLTLTLGNHSF